MPHLLGIDLGTSSVKSTVIDAETLHPVASAGREYPVHHPQPGYAEQHPDDYWEAATHTVREAVSAAAIHPESIAGIGLSGQMHGTVCLGRDNRPLRPAIIWADARSQVQVAQLVESHRRAPFQPADNPPGPPAAGFMASTLMWLAANEPDTITQMQTVVLPKDYLRLWLTGTVGTDISDAASTWLLDVARGRWSETLLARCGLDRRYLPQITKSAEVVGTLTTDAAGALGLPAGIPVVAGCADQPAQALGYGLYAPGTALVTVGTGGQVFLPLTSPNIDPDGRYYVFNHAVPERWYALAAMLSAGLSLRWLRDTLGLRDRPDAYAHLSTLAADVPPGSDGLVFLPYLAGERTPHNDPAASGVLLGLRLHHGTGHLARAVMEGVAFALADCLSLVGAVERVILSGGATASPVWRQIIADVFEKPVHLTGGTNHAAVGAALLAAVGSGLYRSVAEACARLPQAITTVAPREEGVSVYQARRPIYRELYPRLKDTMRCLGEG
jgi:xylulokinase